MLERQPTLDHHTTTLLTLEHIDHWRQHGWVGVDCLLSDAVRDAMPDWAADAHRASTPSDPCERREIRQFLDSSVMLGAAGELLEHRATLNRGNVRCTRWSEGQRPMRMAGGAAPNRRAVASVIPLGGGLRLELASQARYRTLAVDANGLLGAGVASGLDWRSVDVPAGEVLWLHPMVPFRIPRAPTGSIAAGDTSVLLAAFSGRFHATAAELQDGDPEVSAPGSVVAV